MTYEDDISKVNIDGDDFIEKSRSNYFKVKHFDEFEELCKQWNLEILYGEHGLRERRDGGRERLQRFLRPHFSVVKTQMQNWDSSSSNEIMSSMFPPTRHSI